MTTTIIASVTHDTITLADGTSFKLDAEDIQEYEIHVWDQVFVLPVNGQRVVTIAQTNHHKADIALTSHHGYLEGRVTVGAKRKREFDPASPFAGERALRRRVFI